MSGAKSDGGGEHMPADVVRTDAHQLRPAASDSLQAEVVKVLARIHKTLIWERTAVVVALRAQLLEYFPAAVAAFQDLDAPAALEPLGKAPDPARAAKLNSRSGLRGPQARRRYKIIKTDAILAAPRSPQLGQPPAPTAVHAATLRSLIAVITTLNEQVRSLQGQVEAYFASTSAPRSICRMPTWARSTGPRVLSKRARRQLVPVRVRQGLQGTTLSPITRASGKKKIVAARYVRNDQFIDALMIQAFAALEVSPGCPRLPRPTARQGTRAQRHPAKTGQPAGRHPARMLQDRTCYDEAPAWGHRETPHNVRSPLDIQTPGMSWLG